MLSGPPVRKRKNEKAYKKHTAARTNECDFCEFTMHSPQVLREFPKFWIVKNLFGYDIWDGITEVYEHLMVVPKRHVDSIAHFNATEAKEYIQILSEYEQNAYSIYARAPQNTAKSIPHQHTHLIRLGNKKARIMLYVHKPHILKFY